MFRHMLKIIASGAFSVTLVSMTNGTAKAQTVQLPVFHYFAASTSVMVPDGGTAFIGGVGSASSGSNSRRIPGLGGRPFANSATAGSTTGGGVSVSATIQDLSELDQAVLSQAAATGKPTPEQILATGKSSHVGKSTAPVSLAEIRAQQSNQAETQDAEARDYFAQGEAAYASGKLGVAKVYYQMCLRRATGELLSDAKNKLKLIAAETPTPRVAGK
jgi:type II secretory pathway component HofQ